MTDEVEAVYQEKQREWQVQTHVHTHVNKEASSTNNHGPSPETTKDVVLSLSIV